MDRNNIEKLRANKRPKEFNDWIDSLRREGYKATVVIVKGLINHVEVEEADNGNWDEIMFGRITLSDKVAIKQRVYKPILYNGIFIKNYDGK